MHGAAKLALGSAIFSAAAIGAGPSYREFLAKVSSVVLEGLGVPLQLTRLDLIAPLDIALFVALVLCTSKASRAAIARMLILGLPGILLFEVGSVVGWILIHVASGGHHASSPIVEELQVGFGATVGLVAPVVAWTLLLPKEAWPRQQRVARPSKG